MKYSHDRAEMKHTQEQSIQDMEKKNELLETQKILKLQMDSKNQKGMAFKEKEQQYRSFLDKTVNLLTTRDKELSTQTLLKKNSYADDLRRQMIEQKEANVNRYNVMNPVDRKMNVKGISAFEAAENKTSASIIPGMERDKGMQRENFHRTSLRNSINVTKQPQIASNPILSPIRIKHIQLG